MPTSGVLKYLYYFGLKKVECGMLVYLSKLCINYVILHSFQ